MKKQSGIVIVPEIPYPPKNGWNVRHCSIIKLIASDIYCDVIAINSIQSLSEKKTNALLKDRLNIRKLCIFKNRYKKSIYATILGFIQNKLPGSAFYDSKELKKFLKNSENYSQYNFILILGGICMMQYAENIKNKRIIWDMCDDSVLVYKRLSRLTNNLIKKAIFNFQAKKIEKHIEAEANVFESIMVISKKDGKFLKKFYKNKIIDIPNLVFIKKDFAKTSEKGKYGKNIILFTGAMQTRPNRDAAFFL